MEISSKKIRKTKNTILLASLMFIVAAMTLDLIILSDQAQPITTAGFMFSILLINYACSTILDLLEEDDK
jgi:hypothetical protein